MSKRIKLILGAGGAVALLAIVLAGVMATRSVMAQTPPSGQTPTTQDAQGRVQDFLSKLAANLGISQDQLTTALKKTETEMVDEAVQQGKLTQDQANQLKQRIQDSPNGLGGFGMHGRHMGGQGPRGHWGQKDQDSGNGNGQQGAQGSQTPAQQQYFVPRGSYGNSPI